MDENGKVKDSFESKQGRWCCDMRETMQIETVSLYTPRAMLLPSSYEDKTALS